MTDVSFSGNCSPATTRGMTQQGHDVAQDAQDRMLIRIFRIVINKGSGFIAYSIVRDTHTPLFKSKKKNDKLIFDVCEPIVYLQICSFPIPNTVKCPAKVSF